MKNMKIYLMLSCVLLSVLLLFLAGCRQEIVIDDGSSHSVPVEKTVPKDMEKPALPAAVKKDLKCNCTEDYIPVCGNDTVTYMNKCDAECSKAVYADGECNNNLDDKQIFPCGDTTQKGCSGAYVPVCGKIITLQDDFIRWETFSNACTACRYLKNYETLKEFTRGECS
jgi:hypothetical protein